jgi:large subunit ribosomal protein L4
VKVTLYNQKKENIGNVELKDEIFATELNKALVHEIVVAQRANLRQGSADTKTRGDMSGSTAKVFKQKGTGRARQGDKKSPVLYGGGTVFGPHPKSFFKKINKKAYTKALCSILSERVSSDALFVVDSLKLSKTKTKTIAEMLKKFGAKKCLFVDNENDELMLSARNIKGVKTLLADHINVYDILLHDNVILSKGALEKISERITSGRSE